MLEKLINQGSLEALWSLNLLGELNTTNGARWLLHSDPHIRRWVIRLAGDHHLNIPELAQIAGNESDIQVRTQIASTAKRMDPELGLSMIRGLLSHEADLTDPHQPLLIWWAIESHCDRWAEMQAFWSKTRSGIQKYSLRSLLVG